MHPHDIDPPPRVRVPVARTFVHFTLADTDDEGGHDSSVFVNGSLASAYSFKINENSECCDHDSVRVCPLAGSFVHGDVPERCQCQCVQCQTQCRYARADNWKAYWKLRNRLNLHTMENGNCVEEVKLTHRSRFPSAPHGLDREALREHRLRLIRRFVAEPTRVDEANISDSMWRWNYWNDLVHSTVLVNECRWRTELNLYEEKRLPYYLPAPRDCEDSGLTCAKSFTKRIVEAKRAATEALGSIVCNLTSESVECSEWDRLVWGSPSTAPELWPAKFGKRSRPRQLQGKLRCELEPLIWVRVDVQRRSCRNPLHLHIERGSQESQSVWEREPFVRCYRESDQIQLCKVSSNEECFSSDNDVRNLLSLLDIQPLLSSQSLLLLPPLSSFAAADRCRVPHILGMEPLALSNSRGLAMPKSWVEASQSKKISSSTGIRELLRSEQRRSSEQEWLHERRVTLMLGARSTSDCNEDKHVQ